MTFDLVLWPSEKIWSRVKHVVCPLKEEAWGDFNHVQGDDLGRFTDYLVHCDLAKIREKVGMLYVFETGSIFE